MGIFFTFYSFLFFKTIFYLTYQSQSPPPRTPHTFSALQPPIHASDSVRPLPWGVKKSLSCEAVPRALPILNLSKVSEFFGVTNGCQWGLCFRCSLFLGCGLGGHSSSRLSWGFCLHGCSYRCRWGQSSSGECLGLWPGFCQVSGASVPWGGVICFFS